MAATAHFHFREQWQELKRGRPGHRFQDRYQRNRREAHRCGAGQRLLRLVGGVIAVLIGVVLVIIPGPALPFFFIAGGLFATESRTIARFMDWSEVRLRNIGAWAKRRWRQLPTAARVGLLILGACGSAGTMYLSYRLLHR
jgi:hypothetical protein